MTIQKKSLISTLNTTKKAIVASTQVELDAPATKNAAQQSPARRSTARVNMAKAHLARRSMARASMARRG